MEGKNVGGPAEGGGGWGIWSSNRRWRMRSLCVNVIWSRISLAIAGALAIFMMLTCSASGAALARSSFRVAVESALTTVFKDSSFPSELHPVVHLFAAKNACDDAQVVVIAGDQALRDVRVTATDLVNAKAHARLSRRNIELSMVGYVKTGKPSYAVDRVGWWPDPLLPLRAFEVPAEKLQPLWLTVQVPPGTLAGDYEGHLTIKPEGRPSTDVALRLRIWNFTLPTRPHMRTAFGLQIQDRINPRWEVMSDTISQFYNWVTPQEHDQILTRICRLLLQHKVSPSNPVDTFVNGTQMDLAKADRLLAECVRLGLTGFSVGYPSPKYPARWPADDDIRSYLHDYGRHLREKGWLSMAYFYSWDEPTLNDFPPGGVQESFHRIRDLTSLVREACPGLKVLVTTPPSPELDGAVDIWVPITAQYQPQEAREYQAKGDQVWWYTCNWPHQPYANLLIDEPAIDHRILFWQAWRYGVTGFLYWAVDNWGPNVTGTTAIQKWPNRPWNTFTFDTVNGDGQLIYPGPGGQPYSSVRLECVRDGIEDYEYLWQLQNRLTRLRKAHLDESALITRIEQLLAAAKHLAPSLTDYTHDPSQILRIRQQMGELIDLASHALSKPMERGAEVEPGVPLREAVGVGTRHMPGELSFRGFKIPHP